PRRSSDLFLFQTICEIGFLSLSFNGLIRSQERPFHHLLCNRARTFTAETVRKITEYRAAEPDEVYCTVFIEPVVLDGEYGIRHRSEEHTSELQARFDIECRLLLEKNTT